MLANSRLKIAVQKNGRLNNDSMDLLLRCGLRIKTSPSSLLCHVENLPIDLLFVRDDDIPTLVADNVCDLGIVGENVLQEHLLQQEVSSTKNLIIAKKLGFCSCRLAIAIPKASSFAGPKSLQGLRIATSFPALLKDYLRTHQIEAEIVCIAGSVEIAPRLDIADAICDLVSTGRTLVENNLLEVQTVMKSEAVIVQSNSVFSDYKNEIYELLLRRIESVLKAQDSKYIMFHAPLSALNAIHEILPGAEMPTIMPLQGATDKVAVHVVSTEGVFWNTLERLKQAGASSILVLPIEKMLS